MKKVTKSRDREASLLQCQVTLHMASRCSEKAMYCGDGRHHHKAALQKVGLVEGRMVEDIVLDIGCSKTLIHHTLVPQEKMLQGEAITIRCAHGDNAQLPGTCNGISGSGWSPTCTVKAAVSKTLPISVLLGMDVPELMQFVRTNSQDCRNQGGYKALMMVTQAGAKKQENPATGGGKLRSQTNANSH